MEIGKAIRERQANYELVEVYWDIGRLIVDAQGGKEKAKYGDAFLKEWADKLTQKYGKGYDYSNLARFRKLYLCFPILGALRPILSWTILRKIISIKDENKRNYYINLCIEQNLSQRQLIKEIKNNSYERLVNKPDRIDIIAPTTPTSVMDSLKNPIVLELKDNKLKNEADLEKLIYSQLASVLMQLGSGFTWVGNQYKIVTPTKTNYIDMLLYNIKHNCYVVVELKLRELRKEDKGQIELYMKLVDTYVKENHVNNTLGIIITKEQDKLIANFVRSEKLVPIIYEIKQ